MIGYLSARIRRKLGMFHEGDGQEEDIVVMDGDPLGRRGDLLSDGPDRRGRIGLVSRRARDFLLQVLQQGENPPLDPVGRRGRPDATRRVRRFRHRLRRRRGSPGWRRRGTCARTARLLPVPCRLPSLLRRPEQKTPILVLRRRRLVFIVVGGIHGALLPCGHAKGTSAMPAAARTPIRVTRTPGRPIRRQNNTHRRRPFQTIEEKAQAG